MRRRRRWPSSRRCGRPSTCRSSPREASPRGPACWPLSPWAPEGCQLGTRFALSRESSACEAFKRRCVEVQEGGTILTLKKVIPTRLVRNGFCRTVEEAESRGADAEELSALIGRGRPKRGIFEGDLDEGELEIGQIAALIEDLPPAGEILRRLVAEYEAARGSLGPL